MYITILLFLLLDFFGYRYILEDIHVNNEKDQKILYYEIDQVTSTLITKLLFEFQEQKEILKDKHEEVLRYLENHDYDDSLNEIYKKINAEEINNPYNIYITDSNLVINNTTYKSDKGFDLSFAKELFDKHKRNNEIGISPPVFPSEFLSHTDSYLPRDGGNRILQISYKYKNISELAKLKNLLESKKNIKNYTAYMIHDDGMIVKLYFNDIRHNKPALDNILKIQNDGKKIVDKLSSESFITETLADGDTYFYGKIKSNIFDSMKMTFTVSISNKSYNQKINNLNIIMIIFTIVGLLGIYLTDRFARQEKKLKSKNQFITHSVHEIKTPLSIISLNNELRSKKLGRDRYSDQIEGAIRTLKNSYDDMTFLLTKDRLEYEKDEILISNFLNKRVKYFNLIALSQSREIKLIIEDTSCKVSISEIELTRLIDNNLSNAIKYSDLYSTIIVSFKDCRLLIKSIGMPIENPKNIFKKFVRENSTVGGHGLGLNIVSDICNKYNIEVDLFYNENFNVFSYKFQKAKLAHDCHKN